MAEPLDGADGFSAEYIEGFYNTRCRPSALGNLSPSKYEEVRLRGGAVAQRQTVRVNGANPVRIFPNREARLRLVTALAVEHSEEWITGRCYLDMEKLREHRRLEECEAEEVMLVKRLEKGEAYWRRLEKLRDLTLPAKLVGMRPRSTTFDNTSE